MVLQIFKRIGETPLECLNRLREEHPEYKDAILSYAGRLDPLAEGIMLVLVGEENKNREKYLHLDKEYEVEILLGVATDTHDVLGLITDEAIAIPEDLQKRVEENLQTFVGTFDQPYPAFSSKTINGVSLFELTKSGATITEVPLKKVSIYSIENRGWHTLTRDEVLTDINKKINLVKGDFRQEEILKRWQDFAEHSQIDHFQIITIKVACSSGTYMRTLAHELGKKVGAGALAWRITRTKVGEYTLASSSC